MIYKCGCLYNCICKSSSLIYKCGCLYSRICKSKRLIYKCGYTNNRFYKSKKLDLQMRFLRLVAFVNAFYPKYFYAPQQFRSFFQFFRLRCSSFSFASRLRTSLHCWSKVRILIPEICFLPFNLHIGFRFLMPFVSFHCWSKALFHWLSVAAPPLLPLPLPSPLPLFLLLPYYSSPPTWFTHKVGF